MSVGRAFYGSDGDSPSDGFGGDPGSNGFGGDPPRNRTTWEFNRGIRAFGTLGKGFFFDTRVHEVQEKPANAESAHDDTAPRLRAVKLADDGHWDYGIARAVIGFHSEHIELRFGRDKNVLGTGRNTFWLSNYAAEYDFVQFRASFWRIRYTGMLAAFDDLVGRSSSGAIPRKYGSFHLLGIELSKRLVIELYEGILVTDDTTTGVRPGLDISLFNPLLHLRQVEVDYDNLGTKSIGIGGSYYAGKGHTVRTQLLLTEFTASKIFSEPGYWANKWGILLGYDYTPASIPLMLRFEYSTARPHTYSHQQSGTSFIHYDDVLGHPAEQNFRDWTFSGTYGAGGLWEASLVVSRTLHGANSADVNYGGDPRVSYLTRHSDNNNSILQGIREEMWFVDASVSRQLIAGFFVGVAAEFYSLNRSGAARQSYLNPRLVLRWGVPNRFQRN